MIKKLDEDRRYAVCPNCGYIEDWALSSRMRCDMPCPRCEREDTFGPTVYKPDFHGYTWGEAQRKHWLAQNDWLRRGAKTMTNNQPQDTDMTEWKRYQRKAIPAQMRPYEPGETLAYVSISASDRENGSPKPGDMIARDPNNHADQWLVSKEYFESKFDTTPISDKVTY